MNKKQKAYWLVVAILSAICISYYVFYMLYNYSGRMLLATGGDGGKNYFAYLYHSINDRGTLFKGMNYPFGDNIIYADGQPLLSIPLSYLSKVFPLSISMALSIMHFALILNFILAIVFTYKTLNFYGLKPVLAILFATLIVIMSPQMLRLDGHFSLSYLCFLPMLFYWTMRYHHDARRKYLVYIFCFIILMFFMHPYYMGIATVFIGLYSIGYFITTKGNSIEKLKHVSQALLSLIAALGFVKIFLFLTDPITDRPYLPPGALSYCTHVTDLYASYYSPLWRYWGDKKVIANLSDGGESYNYLGIVICITLIMAFVAFIFKKVSKKSEDNTQKCFPSVWLFIGIFSLLLAMGIPFIWNMEWLLRDISLFRQFRSLGRFAWIFYYVAAVFAVVQIYTWYLKNAGRHKIFSTLVLVSSLVVWSVEANEYIGHAKKRDEYGLDRFDDFLFNGRKSWADFFKSTSYSPTNFQAILTAPYVNIGTDKLWVMGDKGDWLMFLSYSASLQLQLPMINTFMARGSWSQAEQQVRLAAGPWSDKSILKVMNKRKPFLLLKFNESNVDPDQQYLLQASDSIGQFSNCTVYACYPDRINTNDSLNRNLVKPYCANTTGDTCIKFAGQWYMNHLDKQTKNVLFGKGSISEVSEKDSLLIDIPIRPAYNDQKYEFSCWVLLDKYNANYPIFSLTFLDSTSKTIFSADANTKESVDNKDLWFRAHTYFNLPAGCRRIKCKVYASKTYLALDEVMIRPADAIIVSKQGDGKMMVNNHVYHP